MLAIWIIIPPLHQRWNGGILDSLQFCPSVYPSVRPSCRQVIRNFFHTWHLPLWGESLDPCTFLAATKQLYEWYFLSVWPSVRLSVRLSHLFIRPFEKRLKNGTYYAVAMSVRLSVRPSFPDFSLTCFEISIWNLVYTFSRWHGMSSLSCITIGSLWPSLQTKVGQTHFLQSWPHKSR